MYNEEYNFDEWTPLEMYVYLLDINEIPPKSSFDEWKYLKDDMLRMCKEHKNDSKRKSS